VSASPVQSEDRTIYIAGAGIAGLTLALALAKFGLRIVILERAPKLPEQGSGLQIGPNAWRVLDSLGLSDDLSRAALFPEALDIHSGAADRPVAQLVFGAAMAEAFGAPYAVLHRADLARALHRACKRFANIEILFGIRSFDAEPHARGLSIVSDEVTGVGRSGRAYALVGADGVHSGTRTALLGGPAATYAGRIAWRCLVPFVSVASVLSPDRSALFLGRDFHLVAYPLPPRGVVNLAMFRPHRLAEGAALPQAPVLPRQAQDSKTLSTLFAAAQGSWTPWPLNTVSTDTWYRGPVGLIGDAAHAMLPFQAQGAAMAIEDAAVLAPLLATAPTPDEAFAAYARIRRPRVARVARISAANGRIFHMAQPFGLARDLGMRILGPRDHIRRLGWLYGHDALAQPSLE
jgi:salicylate hydroxylase